MDRTRMDRGLNVGWGWRRGRRGRGFTLIEVLVVISVIALLISILLPALSKSRKSGRTLMCFSNMRQMGVALSNYAADWRQVTSAFSWKPGQNQSRFTDLNGAGTYLQSHADQAIDIVRRKTTRNDGYYQRVTDRFLDRNFGHLPLIDGGYFSERIPETVTSCPEDRNTRVWQRSLDIESALRETGDPDPGSSLGFKRILPFWCTYQFVPNSWSREIDVSPLTQATGGPGLHLLYYWFPTTVLGNRNIVDVTFPSQKVWVFDLFDRHSYGRTIWHSYEIASQPLLFFDGSVTMRRTRDANKGWHPNSPGSLTTVTTYQYWPTSFEPRTLSGQAADVVTGYYRWTRSGLKGVDFGGGEQVRW